MSSSKKTMTMSYEWMSEYGKLLIAQLFTYILYDVYGCN